MPSVLHYHYSTSRVPIGQDKISCILIGLCQPSSGHYGHALQLQGFCFYWSGIALLYSRWFRHARFTCLVSCTTASLAPHVPIGQDELNCILIGSGMRFTTTLACMMDLHFHYSAPCVPIGQDELNCILIGSGMRFTTTLACMMDLHYRYFCSPCSYWQD